MSSPARDAERYDLACPTSTIVARAIADRILSSLQILEEGKAFELGMSISSDKMSIALVVVRLLLVLLAPYCRHYLLALAPQLEPAIALTDRMAMPTRVEYTRPETSTY